MSQQSQPTHHHQHRAPAVLLLFLLIVLLVCASGLTFAYIPSKTLHPDQLAAFQLFYDRLGGTNWHNNTGWTNSTNWADVCHKVYGLVCDGEGYVYQINMVANNLVGVLPSYGEFFKYFPQMSVVLLTGNLGLTGTIPDYSAAPQPILNTFEAGLCSLHGTIPSSILTGVLQNFQVAGNKRLHGEIPAEIGGCFQLQTLVLGQNDFGGDIPDSLCNCRQLTQFDISNNKFTSIPSKCMGENMAASMQLLDIAGNPRLSLEFPKEWCKWTNLVQLHVQDNMGLHGELPADCTWPQLTEMVIERTNMRGGFPSQVFNMQYMRVLILSLSAFKGPVPDKFDRLPVLQTISLNGQGPTSGNTWTGPIPTTLFNHSSITSLTIQYTQFTGVLPQFSTSMEDISQITIAGNTKLSSTGKDFPVNVLYIWQKPTKINQKRTLYIPSNNLLGLLPDIDFKIYNLSDAADAINFRSNNWFGYIPESLLDWVPNTSQNGMLHNCDLLFAPIAPSLKHLVSDAYGFQWTVIGTSPSSVPRWYGFPDGMTVLQVRKGPNCVFDSYHNEFRYMCSFCRAVTFDQQHDSSWCANLSNVQQLTYATVNTTTCSFNCPVPGGGVLARGPVMVRIVYHGQNSSGKNFVWTEDLSNSGAIIQMYEDRPPLHNITPSVGRFEGCTTVNLFGEYFSNLPRPVLVLTNRTGVTINATEQPDAIRTAPGNIKSDNEIEFVVPFAGGSWEFSNISFVNQSVKHDGNPRNTTSQLLFARLYPAGTNEDQNPGVVVTETPMYETLNYSFIHSHCRTPLVPCHRGHTDKDRCPNPPMCRCSSNGLCLLENFTLNVTVNETTTTTTALSFPPVPPPALFQQEGGGSSNADGNSTTTEAPSPTDDTTFVLLNESAWMCHCDFGFNGSICDTCDRGFWGIDCSPCDCDHGMCDDGIRGSGECKCSAWWWVGKTCNINLFIVVGSSVGGIVFLIVGYKVHKNRFRIKEWYHKSCLVRWWTQRRIRKAAEAQRKAKMEQDSRALLQDEDENGKNKHGSSKNNNNNNADGEDKDSRDGDFSATGYSNIDGRIEDTPTNKAPAHAIRPPLPGGRNSDGTHHTGGTPASNSRGNSRPGFTPGGGGGGFSVSRMYQDDPAAGASSSASVLKAGGGFSSTGPTSAAAFAPGSESDAVAASVTAPLRRMSYGSTDSD